MELYKPRNELGRNMRQLYKNIGKTVELSSPDKLILLEMVFQRLPVYKGDHSREGREIYDCVHSIWEDFLNGPLPYDFTLSK